VKQQGINTLNTNFKMFADQELKIDSRAVELFPGPETTRLIASWHDVQDWRQRQEQNRPVMEHPGNSQFASSGGLNLDSAVDRYE
jgi:hypothetical protein